MDKSEGFWREFFLLKPDQPALRSILEELGPGGDDLLHIELQTRELFARAVACLKGAGAHGFADGHALDVSTQENEKG